MIDLQDILPSVVQKKRGIIQERLLNCYLILFARLNMKTIAKICCMDSQIHIKDNYTNRRS